MASLLHLSDPHFGTERERPMAALMEMLRGLTPEHIVISGDLTQRATADQFRRAAAFVERLGELAPAARLHLTPGNHDLPVLDPLQRLLDPFAPFRAAFGRSPESVHEDPLLHLQVLNTVSPWRHKHGVLRREQVDRVVERLALASPRQLRMIVTHQPLAVARPDDRRDLLRGRQQALERWPPAGADLVLGGHIHLPYVARIGNGRATWVVQAGTVVSSRIRHEAGNSFNLIRYAGGNTGARPSCAVERWDFCEQRGEFRAVSDTPLPLAAAIDR
ncbi:MAG: metallophosphoesterase [Zoogloeaceae bacterium]|nr:metallophosphoesterase [Rhodocyclaceae bacterium]MCP5234672.1 metallophosphoesterase [Zoogloeaceae bacterium]